MKVFALVCAAAAGAQAISVNSANKNLLSSETGLDINQKVYIENAPVLGDGAGEGALNKCRQFAPQHVANADAPAVKVCGTGIKATFYLRNRCADYSYHSQVVGKCDTGMASDTCATFSPADNASFGHYQSYMIEQCS